jgi:hypothetical protein
VKKRHNEELYEILQRMVSLEERFGDWGAIIDLNLKL